MKHHHALFEKLRFFSNLSSLKLRYYVHLLQHWHGFDIVYKQYFSFSPVQKALEIQNEVAKFFSFCNFSPDKKSEENWCESYIVHSLIPKATRHLHCAWKIDDLCWPPPTGRRRQTWDEDKPKVGQLVFPWPNKVHLITQLAIKNRLLYAELVIFFYDLLDCKDKRSSSSISTLNNNKVAASLMASLVM